MTTAQLLILRKRGEIIRNGKVNIYGDIELSGDMKRDLLFLQGNKRSQFHREL